MRPSPSLGERQKVGGQAALRSGSCVCGCDLNFGYQRRNRSSRSSLRTLVLSKPLETSPPVSGLDALDKHQGIPFSCSLSHFLRNNSHCIACRFLKGFFFDELIWQSFQLPWFRAWLVWTRECFFEDCVFRSYAMTLDHFVMVRIHSRKETPYKNQPL
jgi:hypothetical protein